MEQFLRCCSLECIYFSSVFLFFIFFNLWNKGKKILGSIVGGKHGWKETGEYPISGWMKVLSSTDNREQGWPWPWALEQQCIDIWWWCHTKGSSLSLEVTEVSSARISNDGWKTTSKCFLLEFSMPLNWHLHVYSRNQHFMIYNFS